MYIDDQPWSRCRTNVFLRPSALVDSPLFRQIRLEQCDITGNICKRAGAQLPLASYPVVENASRNSPDHQGRTTTPQTACVAIGVGAQSTLGGKTFLPENYV